MINKKLLLIISIISFIAIFFNLFPNWYALQKTPSGYVFTGQASWFDPWDINVYVSAIRWGQTQGFFMENTYTSMPNQAIVYYPVYTLLGVIFANADPFLVFHIFSAITTVFLITILITILSKIFKSNKVILLTTLAISLGGGLGFLAFPSFESIDTHMTSIMLLSAWQRPHEAIALSSYVLSLFSFYFSIKDGRRKWQMITILSLAVTLVFYPYYLLSFLLINLIFYGQNQATNQKFFMASLAMVGLMIVGLMYFNLSLNPTFAGVTGQTLTKPTLLSFSLGYGILLIPLIYQLFFVKQKKALISFLLIWIVVSVSLLLLPVGFARFYLRGMMIALVIVTVKTLQQLCQKHFSAQYPKIWLIFLSYTVGLVLMTNLMMFSYRLKETTRQNPWYYFPVSQQQAFEFLQTQTPPLSAVLSSYYIGNFIPALTDQRVYFGHLLQTPDTSSKQQFLTEFYGQAMDESQALATLKQNQVKYVYFSDNEKVNDQPTKLDYSFLTEVFNNEEVIIYQVATE